MNRGRNFPPVVRPYAEMPRPIDRVPGPYPPGSIGSGLQRPPPPFLPSTYGAVPYDPPNVPLQGDQIAPPDGRAHDYEAATVTKPWLDFQPTARGGTLVWTASRRWRACDVYLELSNDMNAAARWSALVYAVAQSGARTLVASGRLGPYNESGGPGQSTIRRPFWIASARAECERYEVEVLFSDASGGGVTGETASVTIVASDEMTGSQTADGTATIANVAASTSAAIAVADVIPFPELLAVMGTINIAFPTWLHFHDRPGAIAGVIPTLCWPVGSAPGDGIVVPDIRRRCWNSECVLALSSTLFTTTLLAAGEGMCSFTFR